MTDSLETDLLDSLISRKHDLLVCLRDLARKQLQQVHAGDMTALLTVLASKQQLLGQLEEIETQLAPFRFQDPESRRWRSPDDRRRCAETVRQIELVLKELILLERRGEADLQRRRDGVAARLDAAHAADQARKAYHHSAVSGGRRLDLTSEQ